MQTTIDEGTNSAVEQTIEGLLDFSRALGNPAVTEIVFKDALWFSQCKIVFGISRQAFNMKVSS